MSYVSDFGFSMVHLSKDNWMDTGVSGNTEENKWWATFNVGINSSRVSMVLDEKQIDVMISELKKLRDNLELKKTDIKTFTFDDTSDFTVVDNGTDLVFKVVDCTLEKYRYTNQSKDNIKGIIVFLNDFLNDSITSSSKELNNLELEIKSHDASNATYVLTIKNDYETECDIFDISEATLNSFVQFLKKLIIKVPS